MKIVTVLGSTGSVGRTTVNLLKKSSGKYKVDALTADSNWRLLAEQASFLNPRLVAIANEQYYMQLKDALSSSDVTVAAGANAIVEASEGAADWVMAGIVGTAGLKPTMAAVRRGITVAFANKECLVSAGCLMMEEVKKHKTNLLPVDSEHNAIFQVFETDNRSWINKIILTASGGPFRDCSLEEMAKKNPEEALAHPTWNMGKKISIDSATMMNKGLEIIEAHHLFGMQEDSIDVLVHPQSIVHSLVSYSDGSVLAQLAHPDMAVPIAYALAWPDRMEFPMAPLNLADIGSLSFHQPDSIRFPALELAREAIRSGGNANLVLNAANEVAVEGFLARKISFADIIPVVKDVLQREYHRAPTSLEEVFIMEDAARRETRAILQKISK